MISDPLPLANRLVGDYLTAMASAAPAPGGGSASATAAAMGAALVEMVCHIGLRKEQSESAAVTMASIALRLKQVRTELLDLAAKDERAFNRYMDANALPRQTGAEQDARRAAVESALVEAAQVPLEVITRCQEILAAAEQATGLGTPHTLSDVAAGVRFAHAAALNALDNVEANARLMKDRDMAAALLEQAAPLRANVESTHGTVLLRVADRLAQR